MRLEDWFAAQGWKPFEFQREVWQAYLAGQSGLVHAATGTGKTYAAWGGLIEEWLQAPEAAGATRGRTAGLRALWITPLRALAADIEGALRQPVEALGLPWSIESRTGDTTAAMRARQRKRLPTALVTTPESLTLLLARADGRELFRTLRLVVVDEWHELMSTKRGVQLELALARLRRWQPALRTWGLSATLGNTPTAMEVLLGPGRAGRLVCGLAPKQVIIDSLIPPVMDRFPWAGHLGVNLLDPVIAAIEESGSTLVFTNTRSQCEIWYRAILDRRPDWAGLIALHHGSLERRVRDFVENGLRAGRLRCVVCTSSLDLGVDFSPVDRVLQIGSPKGVARLLQRAGRSGHRPGAVSRVTCVPTHAWELLEVSAARGAALEGRIEGRYPLEQPLDVLVQHLVTLSIGGGFRAGELLEEVRTTHAYQHLTQPEWQWAIDFVTRGGAALEAYPDYSRVVEREGHYTIADGRIARRHLLSVGTIASDSAIDVRYLTGGRLGSVEESFIAKLRAGDRFVFAGKTLEFVRVRDMVAYVRRVKGQGGQIPRWDGGRMPLSSELALALRQRMEQGRHGLAVDEEMRAMRHIFETQAGISAIPATDELLIERVETGHGHHIFLYPFEGRLVHEGLAALFGWRIARIRPISFSLACNDYGVELLSADRAPLEEALEAGLFSTVSLADDIQNSLNAAEMARRQFREIARVAGLTFAGYPGAGRTTRQLQASSGLLFDVFHRYDPANLLLHQASREVLERQLEHSRLARTLARLGRSRVLLRDISRPSPLCFPLLIDRTRTRVTSEKLEERVRRILRRKPR